MESLLVKIYKSPKTVLTNEDIALIWQEAGKNNLKSKISYYTKRGGLIRLSRGIFAKDKNFNPKELATSIYAPSYISFETVLREAGIIFQYYDSIFVAGSWTKNVSIGRYKFIFRKLKDEVLFNPVGIINQENFSIASPERAFLDTIYLFPDYYFDNLKPINWEKCFEIAGIYKNKQLIKRLNKYYKNYAQ
ncbi:MAG: hypothetical protein V1698_01920 [bacterium]